MKRIITLSFAVLTLSGLCMTSDVFAAGKAAKNSSDWKVLGSGPHVTSGVKYTLHNISANDSVRHGKRLHGINLVWDDSSKLNNIKFDKKGGGVLKYGDVVAIHVFNGGHLQYKKRDVGVNLVWSTPAVYEWMLMGGAKGQPIKMGTPIGLFNQTEKDFLIYAERPAGINLRWWKDREMAGGWLDRAKAAAKDLVRDGFNEIADEFTSSSKKKDESQPKKK